MDLLEAALRARANAHAPYSGFEVGAAIRCPDGRVFAGCNVENVAFPEGTCAEAGAIAAMVAAGAREIAEVLVVADSDLPVTPCGGCRQKLAEFAKPEVTVILAGLAGELARTTVGALLPGAFGEKHMPRTPP
jgi:cytidine deaminase